MAISLFREFFENRKNYKIEMDKCIEHNMNEDLRIEQAEKYVESLNVKLDVLKDEQIKLEKQLDIECAQLSIPYRTYESILSLYNYYIKYYIDSSMEECVRRYKESEEKREALEKRKWEFMQQIEMREIEMEEMREKREKEERKSKKRERATWGQNGEPDLFDTFKGVEKNGLYSLHYKGAGVMEDEYGNKTAVWVDPNGNLRRLDNNEMIEKI